MPLWKSQMKMRNVLLETRGKLILVINWQRTWMKSVCLLWMIECEQWSWILSWGFPGGASGAGSLRGKGPMQETYECRFDPWVGKMPWRRKRQPAPVSLPGEFHGQRSLAGYSPWDHKGLDTSEVTEHALLSSAEIMVVFSWLPPVTFKKRAMS